MKKLKWILVLIFIALIFVSGIYAEKNFDPFQINKTSTASLVQDNLVELSELTTLKYEYSDVIVSRTEKDIPFSEAIKIIKYSAYIKAGTDFSKVESSYDKSSKTLSVRVPKTKVLENSLEKGSVKVEDVENNLFSDYPTQTVFDEIDKQMDKFEKEKVDQGFLKEADKRLKQMLTSFFKAQGYDNVEIEVY